MFLKNVASSEEARASFQNLLTRVDQISRQELPISCSVGATFAARNGSTFPQIFLSADRALYTAKQGGGARLCLTEFSAESDWRRSDNTAKF